jgi:hypothetical protein
MVGYEPHQDVLYDQLTFELGSMGDIRVDMSMRWGLYRGRIQYFCYSLWIESPLGRNEIERVDTSDSELHRHRFYQHRPQDRVCIFELSPGDENIVDAEYHIQYDYLITHWEQIVDRWHRA